MRPSALRFFGTVLRPSAVTVAAFAVLPAYGVFLLRADPDRFGQVCGLALFFQMFSASTGYAERARRGHFDSMLVGRSSRWSIALVHWIVSLAPGVATWAILAECLREQGDLAYQTYAKICPVKRGMDPELYAGEPYVMPGNTDGPDSPYFGRAGWTWYTGSAAWLFRVSTEWILGVRPTREGLRVDPCIPSKWEGFRMVRQFRGTTFQITVENPRRVSHGIKEIWLDGTRLNETVLPDLRDGQRHQVRVVLGPGKKRA